MQQRKTHGPYAYLRWEDWSRSDTSGDTPLPRLRKEYVPGSELKRVRCWIRRYRVEDTFGRTVLAGLR
jgi:hypothetical protein